MPTAPALWASFLVGQSGSALGTSAGQDLTAVCGGHSLSEPMDLASLSLFGLISSEHVRSPPSGSWRRPRRGSLPDVVGHLYQRAIGRDDPAILNYTLNLVPMSRKSYCFCGILSLRGVNSRKATRGVQDVGSCSLGGKGFFGKRSKLSADLRCSGLSFGGGGSPIKGFNLYACPAGPPLQKNTSRDPLMA